MAKKQKKVTGRNLQFVYEYAKSYNASDAYRKSHPDSNPKYAKIYGNKLKNKPEIQEALKEAVEDVIGPMEKDLQSLITYWRDTMNNGELKQVDRNKASELLAKYHSLFTEKKEVKMGGQVQIIEDI